MPKANHDPVETALEMMAELVKHLDSLDLSTLSRLSARIANSNKTELLPDPGLMLLSGATLVFLLLRDFGLPPAFFADLRPRKRQGELHGGPVGR
jgi:hypothetical protein